MIQSRWFVFTWREVETSPASTLPGTFLSAKLSTSVAGQTLTRQGYMLTLPVNKTVGGGNPDMGHFLL